MCKEWRDRLMLLVYGELSEEESALVRAHLDTCEGCRRAYVSLSALHAFMKEASDLTTAPFPRQRLKDLARRYLIEHGLPEEETRPSWRRREVFRGFFPRPRRALLPLAVGAAAFGVVLLIAAPLIISRGARVPGALRVASVKGREEAALRLTEEALESSLATLELTLAGLSEDLRGGGPGEVIDGEIENLEGQLCVLEGEIEEIS